jgi:hypothetical protein
MRIDPHAPQADLPAPFAQQAPARPTGQPGRRKRRTGPYPARGIARWIVVMGRRSADPPGSRGKPPASVMALVRQSSREQAEAPKPPTPMTPSGPPRRAHRKAPSRLRRKSPRCRALDPKMPIGQGFASRCDCFGKCSSELSGCHQPTDQICHGPVRVRQIA